jgi:photosystem II stability/assembly factor-like uncharacterized protein
VKNILRFSVSILALVSIIDSSFAQWIHTSGPKVTVQAFAVVSKNLFAGTANGVYLTTNYGTSWSQVNTGLADTGVSALAAIGTNLFASTSSGVFLSTNNGTSWKQMNNGLTDTTINKLAVVGTNLFGATNGGGIFVSTNNGTSWTSASGSVFQNAFVALLAGTGTALFASSVSNNIIYRSTDNGTTWAKADSGLSTANTLVQSGSNLVAGGISGIFLSTNNAVSWNQVSFTVLGSNPEITGFATQGTTVFGVAYNAVVKGASNGTNWSNITLDLSLNDSYTTVAVIDTNLFIGTNNNSAFTKDATVWRLSTNQIPTGVQELSSKVPASFSLEQNYPNPFNPMTTIQFSISELSIVYLKVFDLLGREVATLVNGRMEAGVHQVSFDASRLASGIYFYKLETGNFSQTKKLTLLK